jgi:predicted dehydrogenase
VCLRGAEHGKNMLKIAVVDHHLNNYHADTYAGLLCGALAGEDASLVAAYESDPTGDDWSARQGIRRAASPEEAAREADAVLLLAPDNIDAHGRLAADILPLGKPIFLDKVLAPHLAEAREIVALARRHGTPVYSCSALRHARELEAALGEIGQEPVTEAVARGMGAWQHYGIHTLSLALRLMGHGVRRVADTGTATARAVTLDYGDDRRAQLDVRTAKNEWEVFPWAFAARTGDHCVGGQVTDFGGFYEEELRAVLQFFRTGEPPAPIEEALTAVAILAGAERSRRADGAWQTLPL